MATESIENGFYYRSWHPTNDSNGVVMLIHGLGEHCQRYDALGAFLNNANYTLCSMDLPCHGQSNGPRGHVDSFDVFQEATSTLYQRIRKEHPDQPVFLLGHSMGGLIASRFLLDHQDKFRGAMLSGAAIESPQAPPNWQINLITAISKLFPKLKVLQLDATGISRDPAVYKKYMDDPLVDKSKLSAKFLVEMFNTMEDTKNRAANISLPLLIMHGGKDVMTAPTGSQFLYDNVSSADKTLNIYDGLFHEIFNEPEADSIYSEVVAWLNKHTR